MSRLTLNTAPSLALLLPGIAQSQENASEERAEMGAIRQRELEDRLTDIDRFLRAP